MTKSQEGRLRKILKVDSSGLLIVDLQNDFLAPDGKSARQGHNVSAMRAILPNIQKVTDLFYQINRPVIRARNYEDPELRTEAGRDRFEWFEEGDLDQVFCLEGTEGSELYLPAQPRDVVIEKTRISAYAGSELPRVLSRLGIKTLFVTGIKTQRCVARTVQDLYENEPSLHVVVLEDCIASDDVARHNATLAELKDFYPPVLTSNYLANTWGTSGKE